MATDFRKLAVELCLADGKIDETEVKVIKKALYEDGKIQQKEVEFLIDLRSLAQKKAKGASLTPVFENFFFKALHHLSRDLREVYESRDRTIEFEEYPELR